MLIQVRNHVLELEAISFAEISLPDPNSTDDWAELHIVIDGHIRILYERDALVVWQALQRNAVGIAMLSQQKSTVTQH